jgi:hypothetical protein
MENHVDNVEKQAKSRVFSEDFIFCLWKTFLKNLSSLFLKKSIFHVLHKSTKSDRQKIFSFWGRKNFLCIAF